MNRSRTVLTAISLLSMLYATTVSAQQQRSPWSFNIDGGVAHQSDADLKDGDGSFAVDRWFVGAGVNFSWDRRTSLGVAI